jgi:Tfp pilus assembly protein PilN
MSRSVVGLDLDPLEVRGVQVRHRRNGRTVVEAVARSHLPLGSVAGGLVVDPQTAGMALRDWWPDSTFSTRSVIVGLTSAQVRSAVMDQPESTADEIEAAVRAAAPSLLGVDATDHVVDYQVLERVVDESGQAALRVLVAAAPHHLVLPLVQMLQIAGLRPVLVDLGAFAVLRGLVPPQAPEEAVTGEDAPADQAEVAVAVSAGGVVVVTHHRGAPRRLAVVGPGSDDVAVAWPEPQADAWLDAVVAEVDGHLRLGGAGPLSVRLAAPESVAELLRSRLAQAPDRRVVLGDPFEHLDVQAALADIGFRPELAVASGLALAGRPTAPGAHRLDLGLALPRPPAVLAHGLAAGAVVVGVAAVLGLLWWQRADRLDEVEAEAEQAEAELALLQGEIETLTVADELQAEVDQQSALVARSLEGDVAWSKLLQEIATVMPDDVWLRRFEGEATADPPGRFTVDGRGVDHTSSARWLLRMGTLPTVANLWLPDSSRPTDEQLGTLGEVRFSSSGELTDAALSERDELYVPPDARVLGIEPTAAGPSPDDAPSDDAPSDDADDGAEGAGEQ